ncbi:MAG TPA: hypothetical protein VJX16_08920 [Terriglobales bacterium]|nr:hypothetical protein [Terriglobales bacterium]
MRTQNRSRRYWTDLTFKAGLYGLRFTLVRYDSENFLCFQNLPHRHGERLRWNLRNVGKPCLSNLLAATSFVEVHKDVGFFGFKVSGRVIERDMAVLSYPQELNINRC